MRKMLAMLITLALLPLPSLGEPLTHTLERKTVPVYEAASQDARPVADRVLLPDYPLYFLDGVSDLTYVDLTEFMTLLNRLENVGGEDGGEEVQHYTAQTDAEKGVFVCTYEPRNSRAGT